MADFNLIKGRIQKFSRSSIIETCIQILRDVQQRNQITYPFWTLLVLIKWAFLYTKDSIFRSKATVQDINQTVLLIEKFEADWKVIDFKKGITRGMRIIAYQQFWFQDQIHDDYHDRQLVLYTKIKSTFDINSKFKELTALTAIEFIQMSWFTFRYLNRDLAGIDKYDGMLHDPYWEVLIKIFSITKAKAFGDLLIVKSIDDIQSLQKMNDEAYQLYETNFWHVKPFFMFKNQIQILHRSIFSQTCKNFIYDFLKKTIPEEFTTEFGLRMERYVELGLIESGKQYQTEAQLKIQFPQLTKCVDFAIEGNVLVECKAIELHPRAGILRRPEILQSEFEGSIIKSYKQLLATASDINPSISWFGLVVTYKDTYVGFGEDAWKEFLEKPITDFLNEKKINKTVLPPENLLFVSIQDWDHLVQAVRDRKLDFTDILKKAFDSGSSQNPMDRILLFEQALRNHFPIDSFSLSYLDDVHPLLTEIFPPPFNS